MVKDITINSTTYKAFPVVLELGKAEKENTKAHEVTALYICPPSSRQARVLDRYVEDSKKAAALPQPVQLALKVNCLCELINKYQYETYTGPLPDDDDATAKEMWYEVVHQHFRIGNTEDLYDVVLMNGEIDVITMSAWGKRTIITSDNSVMKKGMSKENKEFVTVRADQFSVINKKISYQTCILFSEKDVRKTIDALPDWSVVAVEGRLQKRTYKTGVGLSVVADSIIPIVVGTEEERGDADSPDSDTRLEAYKEEASYGSTEDY